MGRTLLIAILTAIWGSGTSQNIPEKCVRTSWPLLNNGIQLDSYNSNGDVLQSIRIDLSTGDTSQWFINEYNQAGLLTRSYSVIDLFSELHDTRYSYDKNDILKSTETIRPYTGSTSRTIPEKEIQTNDHGDKLYEPTLGNLGYRYDEFGNQILFCYGVENGDTLGKSIKEYEGNRIIKQAQFENGELVSVTSFTYDDNNNLITETQTNKGGEVVSITYHEYDTDGFRTRSYGTNYDRNWDMTFEQIDCNQMKRKK